MRIQASCGAFGAALIWANLVAPVSAQQPQAKPPNDADLFNARVEFICAEDQRPIKPIGYLLALHSGHPDSIRDAVTQTRDPAKRIKVYGDQLAVRGSVAIYVSYNGVVVPLALRRQGGSFSYRVSCRTNLGRPDDFPGVLIRAETADQKSELFRLLKQSVEDAASSGSIQPLLFSGDRPDTALSPLPGVGPQGVTFGALVSIYLAVHQEAQFLNAFQGSASIQSREPGGKIINFMRIGPRPRAPGEAGPDERTTTGTGLMGVARIIGAPLEQKQRRNLQVRLADKAFAAIDLSQPGVVNTFGYCSSIKRDDAGGAGAYVLEGCAPDERRQVPIRIRGFELIALEFTNQPVRLDPLLKSRAYSAPYPARWQGGANDRAEIPGGPIEEVLKYRAVLRQFGLPGCEVIVSPTLTDVLNETLSFPEPPCGTVDVVLPREMFGKAPPRMVEGCRPGTVGPVIAPADGRVRCVLTPAEMKTNTKQVRLSWSEAFEPFDVSLQGRRTSFEMTGADLSKHLRASLPRHDAGQSDRYLPVYRPVEIRYYTGTQPCGNAAMPLGQDGPTPSVAEAGCKALPDRLDLTFQVDPQKSDPAIPLDAFSERVVHTVALDIAPYANKRFEASRGRLNLPIDFSVERKERYANQYTQPAELVVPGARIFMQPDCSDQGGKAGVQPFAKSSKPAEFQWPIYGQVFDNEGRALTDCARSIVERGADTRPYLTFEFKSTRAVGPRRTIILARSQELMDKRGLPKALDNAFARFVATAHEWHEKGAALSPVDVLSVSQDGVMQRIFTGEEAALQPQSVEASIAQLDRTAPKTPDLSLLRLQPETKGADRVLIIMDGSNVTTRQASELRLLGSDLAARKGGGGLQFYLSSDSCLLWQPHSPQLRCTDLGGLRQSEREKVLVDAFTSFLNPVATK